MAGIQIPRLDRTNAVGDASAGRIDVKLPDALPGMEKQDKAAIGLASQATQYFQKVQDDTIDTETTRMTAEYEGKYREALDGAKRHGGNPAEYYAKVDEEMAKYQEEILLKGNELPGLGRDVLNRKIADKSTQFQMHRLQQASAQQYEYDQAVKTTALTNEADGLIMSAELITAGKPDTLIPFEQGIRRISDLILRDGMKNRDSVRPDENGTLVMTGDDGKPMYVSADPSTQLELRKELSERISMAMETMVDAGQLDSYNTLKEKYWDRIDPLKKKALEKNFEKVSIDQKATILSMYPNKAKELLAGESDVNRIKIEDEARQKRNDRELKIEQTRERRDKTFYRNASKVLAPLIDSGEISTLTDLKSHPAWAMVEKIEDTKRRQSLIDAVVVPKESRPDALAKMNSYLYGTDENYNLKTIPEEEYFAAKSGLSPKDRSFFDRQRRNSMIETGAEEIRKNKMAGDELKNALLELNLAKEDDFNRVSGKEFDKLNALKREFAQKLDGSGPMTPAQVKQVAYDYANAIKKKEVFVAPSYFRGGMKVAKNEETMPAETDMTAWAKIYIKENGSAPSRAQIQAFIKKKTGKK